jgi:biopolymer transport protein TolQ
VNEQLSVIDLILHASLVVQLVMLLLAGASVASWAIIFRKRKLIGDARQEADRFESWFWSGVDLGKLFKSIEGRGGAAPGMEGIFHAGFSEYTRVRGQGGVAPGQALEGVRRAMHVEQLKEIDQLEESLATLATIGSTSPYVGLFGTVWGIMSAFHGLGNVQQATLAMVAPGLQPLRRPGDPPRAALRHLRRGIHRAARAPQRPAGRLTCRRASRSGG